MQKITLNPAATSPFPMTVMPEKSFSFGAECRPTPTPAGNNGDDDFTMMIIILLQLSPLVSL